MFEPPSKDDARDLVATLAAKYDSDTNRSTLSEAQVRLDYIDPFLRAFGWDVGNANGLSRRRQDVRVEESVELPNEDDPIGAPKAGNPDYTLSPNGQRFTFVEAKKPAVDIRTAISPAFQIRRYGWSAQLPVGLLTNFEHLVVYDCRVKPNSGDSPATAIWPGHSFGYDEYEARFDELWSFLAIEKAADGSALDHFDLDATLRGEDSFDSSFLEHVRGWRLSIAGAVATQHEDLDAVQVGRTTQRLINRLLFLRVCEDRELEEYGRLLTLGDGDEIKQRFRDADSRYNAGLFKAIDEAEIDFAAIHGVIKQLYYPLSPYAFAVVEPSVLAAVYEQFLAEQIEISDSREVSLVEKPEIVHAGGIASTPGFIVEELIDRTLQDQLAGLTEAELRSFSAADIACGSGVFLLGLFRRILTAREAASPNVPSLKLKHEVLTENLFGVDIDAEAVEVAKFNLMLAVIEDETEESIAAFGGPLLPDLDSTVVCGNSLVSSAIYTEFPHLARDSELLAAVNPFDFEREFSSVFGKGGFDAIVGNPPYVRVQVMTETRPLETEYYKSSNGFASASAYSFDKYLLFLERSIGLLAAGGQLGFIVPNRFTNTLAGREVRALISEGRYLKSIVDFGLEQVFPGGRQTYTCLLNIEKCDRDTFTYERAGVVQGRASGVSIEETRTLDQDSITDEAWSFVPDEAKSVFDGLRNRFDETLEDVAEIFVGVQTSADDVFFFTPLEERGTNLVFESDDGEVEIERDICRPAVRDKRLVPYGSEPTPDAWVIFPYHLTKSASGKEQATLIELSEMQSRFPKCLAYLESHRDRLESRSVQGMTKDSWYRYGRSQSLAKMHGEKIILRVLSIEPQYNLDSAGLVAPGGGDGGPYYLIRPKPDVELPISYLIGVLSHPVIDTMVWAAGGREYRGGYFPHRKAFLKDLPIPTDPAAAARIALEVEQLMEIQQSLQHETDSHMQIVYRRRYDAQKEKVEGLVQSALGLSDKDLKLVLGG